MCKHCSVEIPPGLRQTFCVETVVGDWYKKNSFVKNVFSYGIFLRIPYILFLTQNVNNMNIQYILLIFYEVLRISGIIVYNIILYHNINRIG